MKIKKFENFSDNVHLKKMLDDELFEYFVNLDLEFDVNITCEDLKVRVEFLDTYKLRDVLESVWNFVSMAKKMGEFDTTGMDRVFKSHYCLVCTYHPTSIRYRRGESSTFNLFLDDPDFNLEDKGTNLYKKIRREFDTSSLEYVDTIIRPKVFIIQFKTVG